MVVYVSYNEGLKMLFKNATEFSLHIESIAKAKRLSHMDAVLDYCKDNQIEPEDVQRLISKSLKEKIAQDFMELGFLPKTATLDI